MSAETGDALIYVCVTRAAAVEPGSGLAVIPALVLSIVGCARTLCGPCLWGVARVLEEDSAFNDWPRSCKNEDIPSIPESVFISDQ